MINVCAYCGSYRPDKEILQNPTQAICPDCGHSHQFVQQPLFIICGPSGGGKTAVCRHLQQSLHPFIPLEADILYRAEFNNPQNGPRDFNETWLRVCKNIGQSGQPVVLFHSGGLPQHVEPCLERRYFGNVHYLALVANDETIANRLAARPAWRGYTPESIANQVAYNQWLRRERPNHVHPMNVLDTTHAAIAKTSAEVVRWIKEKLRQYES